MRNFVFHNTTKIVFGKDVTAGLGAEAALLGKKALLVYGYSSIKQNGVYDACVSSLAQAGVGVVEHGGTKPNPVLSHVRDGIEKARRESCDIIIAAGGGSSIDTAKGIAAGVKYSGDVWDFYCGRAAVKEALPVLAVLTIAATGSEMNGTSVITNEATHEKFAAAGPALYPKVSFLDPQNTFSVPPAQTAYGAVDAVSHIIEGYFTTPDKSVNLQYELAEAVMRNVVRTSGIILANPRDYNARADMMWSATLALNGIVSAGLGEIYFINHAIEHSLSAMFDTPHGAGLAVVTCGWFEYERTRTLEKPLARFGRMVFGVSENDDSKAAILAIDNFRSWCADMKVPVTLTQAGINRSEISRITDNAVNTLRVWGIKNYTPSDIEAILTLCA